MEISMLKKVALFGLLPLALSAAGRPEFVPPGSCYQSRCGLWVEAAALAWEAREDGLAYAISDPTDTSEPVQGKALNPDFGWDWGFRLGIGWDSCSCWGLSLDWARFNTSTCNRARAPEGGELHPVWPDAGPTVGDAQVARADWNLHLNIVDLMLNRPIPVGGCFQITPAIGLRSAWVRQTYTQRFTEVVSPTVDAIELGLTCDFWGIGPAFEFGTHWWLCRGLGVYGTGGFSLLFGEFNTFSAERRPDPLKDTTDSFSITRPVLDLTVGLDWTCVWRNCFAINLFVGWEHHYFFSQNMMIRFINAPSTGSFMMGQGALATQGVTFGAKVGF
jgi:Legionella pneumophila major outer membrane protein precursor